MTLAKQKQLVEVPIHRLPPVAERQREEASLDHFVKVMRRRKWWVGATSLVLMALVAAVLFSITPQYKAEAVVMIESRQDKIVNIESVVSALKPDAEAVESEIQILRSRDLAKRAIDHLALQDAPEYRRGGFGERLCRGFANGLNEALRAVHLGAADLGCGTPSSPTLSSLINAVLGKLSTRQIGKSRAIAVSFQAEDPQLAASVVNTIANYYQYDQLEAKFEATRRASTWLADRLDELKDKVLSSERAVEDFRGQAGLTMGANAMMINQQITNASTELAAAKSRFANAEAQLHLVDRMSAGGERATLAQVLDAPVLQALFKQDSELRQRRAELAQRFGPRHPAMLAVSAEVADVAARIKQETTKLLDTIRNTAQAERAKVATLEQDLAQLQSREKELSERQVSLRGLEREASATSQLYETFLSRSKETAAEVSLAKPDARIISTADVPLRPTYPRKTLVLAFGVVMSAVAGIAMAYLVETRCNARFSRIEDVEETLGVPVLSLMPYVASARHGDWSLSQYVDRKPLSQAADAVRGLRTALRLTTDDGGRGDHSVMITSAIPGEGKTTICTWLARTAVQGGERVLVIDGDLRNPNLHRQFGVENELGFAEVLRGQRQLSEVINHDAARGLAFITAGSRVAHSSYLLRPELIKNVIKDLQRQYDLIIIDSPPVLALSDAKLLFSSVDQTVLVCRSNSTSRKAARRCLTELTTGGGGVLTGVVLSMVNLRKHVLYNEDYSLAQSRLVERYYSN